MGVDAPGYCREVEIMVRAQSRSVTMLENNPSLCGYSQSVVEQLRVNADNLMATSGCGE